MGLLAFSTTGIWAPPPNTVTQSLLLSGWPTMRNSSLLLWVAKPWTNRLRKTAVRISQSSTAKPGWFSSPAELNRRHRDAIPTERDEYHPKVILQITNRILFGFSLQPRYLATEQERCWAELTLPCWRFCRAASETAAHSDTQFQ